MSKEILSEILIEGEKLSHFTSLDITQPFNNHHNFTLTVSQEVLEKQGAYILDQSQQLIGKKITVCFGENTTADNTFKGIITEIGMEQDQGLWGTIILKGFSPTYLLEGGYHFASYYKKSLSDIVSKLTSELPSHDMQIAVAPSYIKKLTYTTQYKESNFAFINRLASEYGEWFYYTGEKLYFGKPYNQPSVELLYGGNLEKMSFSMRVVPTNVMHYSYNSENDHVNNSPSPDTVSGSNSYIKKALKIADELYQQTVNQPADIRTSDKSTLDRYALLQKGTKAADTVKIKAHSDSTKLKLGSYATIKIIQKEIKEEFTPEHGEYLITHITHHISGTGNYSNTFEGIPSDNQYIPLTVTKPVAETQMAIVKDNNDPQKMGRIRVQMLWQQHNNDLTDWLRVLTPDAGSSDKVSKNRGFVFIPEVDDQVLVGFRYNDPNRPFVLGSMFNGKIASGGRSNNKTKSISTRSGNRLELNDDKGSVYITDKGGANSMMDGAGNIVTNANAKSTLNVGNQSSINVGGKEGEAPSFIKMDDGGNVVINANSNLKINVGDSTIELKSDGTITINGKSITIGGKKTIDVKSPNNHIKGETNIDGGKVFIN